MSPVTESSDRDPPQGWRAKVDLPLSGIHMRPVFVPNNVANTTTVPVSETPTVPSNGGASRVPVTESSDRNPSQGWRAKLDLPLSGIHMRPVSVPNNVANTTTVPASETPTVPSNGGASRVPFWWREPDDSKRYIYHMFQPPIPSDTAIPIDGQTTEKPSSSREPVTANRRRTKKPPISEEKASRLSTSDEESGRLRRTVPPENLRKLEEGATKIFPDSSSAQTEKIALPGPPAAQTKENAPLKPPSTPTGQDTSVGTTSAPVEGSTPIATPSAHMEDSTMTLFPAAQTADKTSTPRRGRGGARGGRRGRGSRGGATSRPKIKVEPASDDQIRTLSDFPPTARKVNRGGRPRGSRAGTASNRGTSRGGRPRGSRTTRTIYATGRRTSTKRKRKRKPHSDDDDDDDDDADDDDDEGDTSGSEAMILPQLSSSGRRITQASTFTPVAAVAGVIDLDPPPSASTSTAKKPRTAAYDNPPVFLSGPMKRKQRRNPAEAAVCRNCGRGHSPNSNQIVFCDRCNTPWHQYCHDLPISPRAVEIEDVEWWCADCGIEQELKDVEKGRVNAEELGDRTLKWKQDYLMGVDKSVLVRMLLRAQERDEGLSIFEPFARVGGVGGGLVSVGEERVEGKEKEAGVGTKEGEGEVPLVHTVDEDEGYYEEPLPYPKMGNGLPLPPEEDDLDVLVDENELIYSHSWQEANGSWKGAFGEQDSLIQGDCHWCHEPGMIGFRSRECLRCGSMKGSARYQPEQMQLSPRINGWHGPE